MRCEVVYDDKGKLVAIRKLTRNLQKSKSKARNSGHITLGQFGVEPDSGYRINEVDLPTKEEKRPLPDLLKTLSVDMRSDIPQLIKIKSHGHFKEEDC